MTLGRTEELDVLEIIRHTELFEAFDGKTVLVTGCTGLLGSMLVRALYYAGEKHGLRIGIAGQARSKKKAEEILGEMAGRISMVYSDSLDFDLPCDYIIHTASPTASRFFVENPVESLEFIITGTRNMLELAKRRHAVFVYLSSMEQYGVPYSKGEIMTEDRIGIIDHLTPRSCYPEGKRVCECMCAAYFSEYGLESKIVRLAQTFGAGIPLSDNRVSMQFARSAARGRDIILHTEGKSITNFCYLSDAVSGIFTIAVSGKPGEAYNVCNDSETRSIYEAALLVADGITGGKIRVIVDTADSAVHGYAPDNTMRMDSQKLRSLGWKPEVSMAEGYTRLIKYISEKEFS